MELVGKYVEDAMLATKRSTDMEPDVNQGIWLYLGNKAYKQGDQT